MSELMQEPLQDSFVMNMLFNYLGIQGNDRATVEAALPYAQALLQHYQDNIPLINTIVADANKCVPAANIIITALRTRTG